MAFPYDERIGRFSGLCVLDWTMWMTLCFQSTSPSLRLQISTLRSPVSKESRQIAVSRRDMPEEDKKEAKDPQWDADNVAQSNEQIGDDGTFKTYVCDSCGGELAIRKDDAPETVKNRLKVFHDETEPLKAFYEKMGGEVIRTDLANEEPWQNSVTYRFSAA